MTDLSYLELFAGVGGMSLGFEMAGFRCVGHAEIEKFPRRVLTVRWPDTPLFGDVRELRGDQVERPTIVTFGAPCQDLSVAGKRAGLAGERSSLFYEGIRLWHETQATYALYENVLGALSSNKGSDFASVLSAFVGSPVAVPADGWGSGGGVVCGRTGVAAWRICDAQFFGVPQRRRRVFVLGTRTGGIDPAEVLALREGVSGDTPPRREAGEGTAADVANCLRSGGVGGVPTSRGENVVLSPDSGSLTPWDAQSKRIFPASGIFPSLQSAERSGQQQPAVVEVAQVIDKQTGLADTIAPTLKTDLAHQMGPIVAFPIQNPGDAKVVSTLAGDHGNRVTDYTPVVVPTIAQGAHPGSYNGQDGPQIAAAILAADSIGRPRRLTPLECERLMGWPDSHTDVPDERGKPASDSARYKACGNGVATPVAAWIAFRLRQAITGEDFAA